MSAIIKALKRDGRKRVMKKDRKVCKNCLDRPARVIFRMRIQRRKKKRLGRRAFVSMAKGHDLCARCRRDLVNSFSPHRGRRG